MAVAKISYSEESGTTPLATYVHWHCPGCESEHVVSVKPGDPDGWDFTESVDEPTLAPSILVYGHASSFGPDQPRCHCFVRDGQIEFLADCDHALAGQTVAMVELPR